MRLAGPPSPDPIVFIKPHQVPVFGSNSAGHHGGGVAGIFFRGNATSQYRDIRGEIGNYCVGGAAKGFQTGKLGSSYAIVTKEAHYEIDGSVKIGKKRSIPLEQIEAQIVEFLEFAKSHSDLEFLVTPIGTGMAGYGARAIAQLWISKDIPLNVRLPQTFITSMRAIDPTIEIVKPDYSNGILIAPYSHDANGLGAALSHHTRAAIELGVLKQQYPTKIAGVTYNDPKSYVVVHVGERFKGTCYDMPLQPTRESLRDMEQILTLRFIEHPRLLHAVSENGGVDWLNKCEFLAQTSKDWEKEKWQQWEGIGAESPYLRVMGIAYKKALQLLSAIQQQNAQSQPQLQGAH